MTEYIGQLTARQFIEMIANEYVELSHDKVRMQRDDHVRWAKEWLRANPDQSPLEEIRTAWAKRKEEAE
jgi:hypothetical protein